MLIDHRLTNATEASEIQSDIHSTYEKLIEGTSVPCFSKLKGILPNEIIKKKKIKKQKLNENCIKYFKCLFSRID